MRWFKYGLWILLLIFGIYALAMNFLVDDSKSYTVEKEVNYPIEKVYPQLSNLQNLTRWNAYFADSRKISVQYYVPYEGQGAALSFSDPEKNRHGELFLRYARLNSTIKYALYENKDRNPYLINVKLKALPNGHTSLRWFIHTPKRPLLQRSANFFTAADFVENLDTGMINLANVLSNKVDKEQLIAKVKFDTLMVEEAPGQLLLGVNVSSSNRKDALLKNIILNHNKVANYVAVDLGKREDEYGLPVLVTDPGNYKDNEVSYFYGVPLTKRTGLSDNNFSFRTLNASKALIVYYKGNYDGRVKAIQQLLNKARKDSMRNGELWQTFLEPPGEGSDVMLKLSLPVYR